MRGKRGISQIDWVISLAFFAIFLMLFFMFLMSRVNSPIKSNAIIQDAETAFLDDVSWEVERTPLFTEFIAAEPVIAEFYLNESLNYYLGRKCFSTDDNKLFYVAHDGNVKYLVGSTAEYPECTERFVLTHNSNEADTQNSGFEFEDSLLKRANYNGLPKIHDMNYPGDFDNSSYYGDHMIAKYISASDDIMHKSYVMANGSSVLVFLEPYHSVNPNNNFNFNALIHGYGSNYVFNGTVYHGNDTTGCKSFNTTSFIDFYENNEGLAFVFEDADVEICFGGNITVNADLKDFDETSYKIFFHEGDYIDAAELNQGSEGFLGMTKTLTGISEDKLENLTLKTYDDLRQEYDLPLTKDVAYEIYQNSSLIFEYDRTEKEPTSDVFVKGRRYNILYKFANQTGVEVFSRVW